MNSEQILLDINNNIKELTQIINKSSIIKPIYMPFLKRNSEVNNNGCKS